MKCFAGNDATLEYWYECEICGTVVIEDNSDPRCLDNWECPTCKPVKNFPWKFLTKEHIENNEYHKMIIEMNKKIGLI